MNQELVTKLKSALREAEAIATALQIDEIAWLVGSFPTAHPVRQCIDDSMPRIKSLLPEMTPCISETLALLRISDYMNEESIVGRISDLIRKCI